MFCALYKQYLGEWTQKGLMAYLYSSITKRKRRQTCLWSKQNVMIHRATWTVHSFRTSICGYMWNSDIDYWTKYNWVSLRNLWSEHSKNVTCLNLSLSIFRWRNAFICVHFSSIFTLEIRIVFGVNIAWYVNAFFLDLYPSVYCPFHFTACITTMKSTACLNFYCRYQNQMEWSHFRSALCSNCVNEFLKQPLNEYTELKIHTIHLKRSDI